MTDCLTAYLSERTRPVRDERGGLIARIKGPVGLPATGLAGPDGATLLNFRPYGAFLNGGQPKHIDIIVPGQAVPEGQQLERILASVVPVKASAQRECHVEAGANEAIRIDAYTQRAVHHALILGDQPSRALGIPGDLSIRPIGLRRWRIETKPGLCLGEMTFTELAPSQAAVNSANGATTITIERTAPEVPRLALLGICLAAAGLLKAM